MEAIMAGMSTMNISLPDSLKRFVDEQVSSGSYETSSEYVRELIRKERGRVRLRGRLLKAASSPVVAEMGPEYFAELRTRIRKHSTR